MFEKTFNSKNEVVKVIQLPIRIFSQLPFHMWSWRIMAKKETPREQSQQSQVPMGILPISKIRVVWLVKEFNLLSGVGVFALPGKWA